MSMVAAAFVMIAQSAAPAISDAPVVRQSVTASARVMRPAIIRVRNERGEARIDADAAIKPQRRRDAVGTIWIEFN